jgi:hypothetical protein
MMKNKHFDVDPVLQPIAERFHWFVGVLKFKNAAFPGKPVFEKVTFRPKRAKMTQNDQKTPRQTAKTHPPVKIGIAARNPPNALTVYTAEAVRLVFLLVVAGSPLS